MKKNTKNESAKASKRNQSTWKIDVTSILKYAEKMKM